MSLHPPAPTLPQPAARSRAPGRVLAPVFLVGAERSGTTLLRLMLDHHPKLAWMSEFEYAVDRLEPNGAWPELRAYREWLVTQRIFQGLGLDPTQGSDYPTLLNGFLIQARDQAGKSLVGATVHRHFDRLLWLWPDARFIHLVRDPRDVARSCIGMGWAGNVWTGVERWITAEQLWDRLRHRLTEARMLEVRYEDLLAEPDRVLARTCAFVGVDYDPAMLTYSCSTSYEAPDPSLAYQWRRKLSPRQIGLIEARVGPLLTRRGYEPSGLPPIHPGPLSCCWLRAQDRAGRLRWRTKRFGARLIVAEWTARRLRLTRLQRRLSGRIQQIQAACLR